MTLDDDIARLAAAPLFALLERDALRLLTFAAESRGLVVGETLFRRGEPSDGGYVVLSGLVALIGAGGTTLAGPGALIGRSALFAPAPRPATATARQRSNLLRVSPTVMRRMLEEFPDAHRAVRAALADELDALNAGLQAVRHRLDAIAEPRG